MDRTDRRTDTTDYYNPPRMRALRVNKVFANFSSPRMTTAQTGKPPVAICPYLSAHFPQAESIVFAANKQACAGLRAA